MPKSKKQIAIAALGVVAIITITALVTYYVTDKYGNKAAPVASTSNNTQQDNSQAAKPADATEETFPIENTIPEGTISPTTVVNELEKNPKAYDGKELKVRGILIRVSDDQYMITGQEKESAKSITLDAAKPGDIDEYTNDVRGNSEITSASSKKSAVTATSTITLGPTGLPKLTIKSISK